MSYGYGYDYYPGSRTQIDWGHVQFSDFSNVQYSRPDFSDAEDDPGKDEYEGGYTQQSLMRVPTAPTPSQPPSKKDKKKLKKQKEKEAAAAAAEAAFVLPPAPDPPAAPAPADDESPSLPVPPPVPVPPPPTAEESKEAGKVEEEAKEETEGPELTGTQDTTNNEDSPAVGEEVVETETTSEEMASKNDEEKEEAPKDTDGKETPKEQTSPEEASQREDPPSTETSAAKADETPVKEEAPAQEGAPKEEGEAPQPEDPADDTPKDEPASEEGTSGEKSAVETPELEDPAIETPKDDTPTADEVLVKEDAPAPEETLEEPTPTEKAAEDSSATDPPKEDFPATKETPSKEGVPEAEEASTGEEPPAKDQTSVEPETSGAPDKDGDDANNSNGVMLDPSKAIEDEEGERSVTADPAEKSNDPELGVESKLADETPPSAEEAALVQGAKSGEEPQPSEDAKTAGVVTPAEEVKPEDEAPVEDPNPTEETPVSESTPIEETLTAEAKSAEEASPTEEAKPTDEAPVEDPQPTEETSTEEVKSVEAASSTEEVKPTDDTPVEDPKPTEETSTEEASSIEGANPVVEGSAEEPKLTEEIQAEEANPEENSKHTDESPAGGTVAESEVEHSPAEDTLSSSEDLGPAKEPTTEGDPKPEAKSAGEIPVEDKALQSEVEPQPANETSSSPPHPPSDSELNHAGEGSAEEEGPVPDPTPALSTEEAAPEAAKVDEGSKTAEAAEISRAMSDSSDDKAAEGNEVTTPVAALESDTTAGDEAAVAATKPTAESEDDLVPGDTSPVEAGVDAAAKETPAEDSVAEMASKAVAGEKDESIPEGTLSPEDAGDNKEPVKSEETAPGEKEATDITTAIGVDDKPVETEVPAVPVDTEVSSGGNESPPEEAEELGDGKAPSPPETEVASPDGKEISVPEDKPSEEDQVIDAKSAEVLGLQAEITQDESPKEEISKEEASEATKPTEEAAAPEPEPEPAVESAAAKADSFEPEVGSSTEPATEEDVKPESAIEPEVDFVSEPEAVSKAKVESPIEPHEIPPENETEPKASPQESLPVELSPADDPEANHETIEAEGSCESEIAKPADSGEEAANGTEATVVTTTSGAIPETTMEPTEKSEEAIDTTAKAGSDVEHGYMISPEAEDAPTKQETQKAEPDAEPTKDAPTDNPSNKELDASETETKNGESTEHNSIVDESKLGSVPIVETTPAEASQDDNSDKLESGEPAAADLKTEQAGVTLESGSSSDDVPDRQLDPAESKTSEIGETQEESSKPQEKENEQPDATTENPNEAAEPESTVSPDTNATVKDAEPEDAATEAKGDSLAEKSEPEDASKEADNSDNPPEVTTQPPEDGMDTKSDLMAETIVQEPAAVEMDKPVVTEGEVIGPLATEPKDESPVPDISTQEVGEPDTPTGDATEPLPAEKSTDDTEKESSDVVAEKAPKTADETIEVPEVNAETPGEKSEELNPHEGDTSNEAALEPAAADTPEPAADKDPELETPNETIDAQGDPEENHKDSSTPSVSNFDEAKAEVNIEDGKTRSPEVEVTPKEDVEEVTQDISTGGTEATKEAEGTSESTPDENDHQTREPAIPTEDDTTSVESTPTSKEEPSASEKPVTEERIDPVEETPSSNEKVENESALSVSNPDQDESALNDKEQDAPQPAQQAADGASVSDNDPKEVTPAAGEAGTTDETVPNRPEEVEDRTPEETQAAGTLTNGHETEGASEASDEKEAETETGPQALEPVGVENDAITKGEHPEEASEAVVDHKDKDKSSDTATDLPNEAPDDEPAEPATDAVTQISEEEPGTSAPEAEDGTKEETNPAGEVSAVDTLTTDDKSVEAAEAIDNETSDDKSEEKAGPSDIKLAPEVSTGDEPKEEEPTKETPAEKPTAVGESQEAEPVTESSSQESKVEAEAGAEAEIKPSEEKAAPEDQPAEGALAAQDEPEKGSETADSKPEEEATLVEDKQLEDPSASEKPDQDGKTAEEDPAAAAVAEDDPKQATPADAQEETNQITAGGTVEELPTPEDTAAPEEISAQEQIPAATGDAVSSDVKPADDSKVSQDETKPETQEPLAPEEKARPAEEVAPEPEGVTAKSPDEPIDEPPAEGEKKDDQPVKDTAEEEAKAKEDEESKDTLGPIPSNKRQAKKGEEHGSLHDTPIDFAQHLGVFTELNEEVGNGVLEFDSDDTQHHQGIPHSEENTALETITHHPSQLPVAVASGDQNNQTLAETTMPGSQEPSSGKKRSNAAAEDNSAPLESKAEILDDAQENLISGHVPQPGLTPLSTPIDLDATDDTGLAASPPATEAHNSTKISTPDAPHEQGLAGQSRSAVRGFATERPVNISLQDPISIAEPQPQQPGTESETHAEESQSKPAQDAHDENEKSRIMEPDLPFIVARSTSSSPAASVISDEDSETSVPSHTAASELHRQPLEIQDPASRVEAEADKPSPGLLQPIPTPEPSSHEPKILETDFDNVLQTSRELTQDPAMRRAEPEGQEKEESDISEAESVGNDVSTLEEHMQELATPSHVRESEPSEVAKATEAQENDKIPDEATQPSKRGLTEETTLGELEDSDSISRDSSPDEALGIKSGPGDRPSASTDAEPVDISQKAIASDEDSDDDINSLDQQSVASRSNSIDQAISLEDHQNRQVQAEPVSPGVDEPATALHLEPIKLEDPAEEISDLDDSGSEDDSEDDNSEASPKFEPQPATGISLPGDSVQESNEPVIERQPIPPVLVSSTLIKEDVSDSDENDSEPEHDSLSSRAQDGPREDLRANSPKLEPSSVLQTTGARRGSPSNDEEPSEPLEPTDPNLAVVDEQPKDNPDRAIDQSEELDLSDSASSLSMATDIQKGVVSSDQPQPNSPHHGLPHPEPETAIPELAITAQTGASSEAKSSVNLSRSSSPGSVDEEQLDSTAVPRKPLEHSDADSESEVEGTENEAKTEPSSLPQTVPGKDDSHFATGDEPEHRGISVAAVSVVQPNHGYLDSEKMLETPRTVQGRGLQDKHESLEKVSGVELPAASDDGLQIESRSIASSTDDEVDRKATATAATDDESNDDLPASREISPIGIDRISAPHQPEVVEQPVLEAETSQAKNARVDGTDIEVMPPHETENIGTRRTTPEIPEWPDNEPEGDRPVHLAESQGPPALTYATSSGTMRGVEDEFRALNERSPDEEQIHNYTTFVGLRDQRLPSVERPHQDLSDHMLHEVKTPDTDDTQGSEPKPVQAAEVKPLELVRPEHMAVKVVDIPSRDKGKAVASIPESPKRSSSASRSTRLSRAEPPRTFLTQQQRPRRSLRVRPVTEVYTKDPIFIPAASRPVDTKPIQRPQPPRAESEPAKVPVRPPLVHRSLELQGDPSTTAVRSEKAPRPRSFQAEGESSTGHVRHDLRHPAVTIEEGLRDAAYRAAPSAGSTVEAEVQRSPSPGIVIPDADMIDLQRARTLRRTRKTSIRRAEDTLAAAVVIYATAEALSPPGSPSPFIYQRNGGLPNLEHQMDAEPNDYSFPAVSPSLRSFDDEIEELHKSNADLFTDDRSRESDSSRSDRDRDRHRRRRHSHHSNRSGGSRGEEDRERRYRGDDERRAHRPREEDEGRHRRLSHREGESRYRRHREEDETQARDSRGEADAKLRSSRGPEEPRTRGYRRDEDSRPREYRRAEEPTSRAPPPPRRMRAESADDDHLVLILIDAIDLTRSNRALQARHPEHRDETVAFLPTIVLEALAANVEPLRNRLPTTNAEQKGQNGEHERKLAEGVNPRDIERKRRARAKSLHSERPRYEEPRERPREESVPPAPVPEKKFFAVKNSEGVLGSTTPPREEPVIAEPVLNTS
ncbi:hypothetical protein RAB80_002935 [Fusarium oxysporum f. sp. vasinfectum]|nr:hypothetical protein RAB80_002935 [Fusarium oxysporum f. sp. vasinfectum]